MILETRVVFVYGNATIITIITFGLRDLELAISTRLFLSLKKFSNNFGNNEVSWETEEGSYTTRINLTTLNNKYSFRIS